MGAKFLFKQVNRHYKPDGNWVGNWVGATHDLIQKQIIDKLPLGKCTVKRKVGYEQTVTEKNDKKVMQLELIVPFRVIRDGRTVVEISPSMDAVYEKDPDGVYTSMTVSGISAFIPKADMKRILRECR